MRGVLGEGLDAGVGANIEFKSKDRNGSDMAVIGFYPILLGSSSYMKSKNIE